MLLCFDLDNTLVYSNRIHIEAFNKAFRMNGLNVVSDKRLVSKFGKIGIVLIKELFPEISNKKARKISDDHNRIVLKETARFAKPIPGALSALKKLNKMGFKTALLSNCSHPEIIAILKNAGIDQKFFSIIVGSNEVRHPKPWPDELLKAKRKLHAKDLFMIGDTTYDVKTGKKAGAMTISVLTGDHTRKMILAEKPDFILKSIRELPELMNKLRMNQ